MFDNYREYRELQICATDDGVYEEEEDFSLVLHSDDRTSGDDLIGFPDEATVIIVSDDQEETPPVSCEPDCVYGECAEGNTCFCQTGYAGNRCQTRIMCSPPQIDGIVESLQNSYDVYTQVTISCGVGYKLVGKSTLTCTLVADNYATWFPQPPICIDEVSDNGRGYLGGIILGGIAVLGVILALSLIGCMIFRKAVAARDKKTGPQQQDIQLVPYNGANQYPFTGDAQRVPQPLMF
ncbi:uncharacterized protein [Amphiura filiformis]|uniref:uncharacterized protein n=1 Tax=Amphiura filiformis TaxID=82378 RepID=UPI003B20FABE